MSAAPSSAFRTVASTLPALLILLLTVAQGTGEIVLSRMLSWGEQTWPGYAELRMDEGGPTCDPESFGKPPTKSEDDELLKGLLDGPAPAEGAPTEEGTPTEQAPPAPTPAAAPTPAPADAPPPSEQDLLDDLLGGDAPADAGAPDQAAQAIAAAKADCERQHAEYAARQQQFTPGLNLFLSLDRQVVAVTDLGRDLAKASLIVLLMLCGLTATLIREHIALRPVRSVRDNQIAAGTAMIANLIVAWSCWQHYHIQLDSGVLFDQAWLPLVWVAGFTVMAASNLQQLAAPSPTLTSEGGLGHALLTPPLYATMALISAVWFFGFEQHPSGIAIQLDKLLEQAGLYIEVGLYVWAGMLLKRTQLAHLCFDVLRPWRLGPELLVIVVVTLSAIPTAYSGASGIFVIAAGAIIYEELRRAGARNQLAMAATAMSGSLGVVLSPCLLVVIVAAMNKQVTTTELFGAGRWVFLLTATLFAVIVLLTRDGELRFAPLSEALPGTRDALRKVLPYVAVAALVFALYGFGLGAWLNEHNASKVLLVVLLAMLAYERLAAPGDGPALIDNVHQATAETTGHIGALLLLMALSVSFGGVVDRAEVMSLVPDQIDNVWLAMAMLTVMLVGVGMMMDPYGAVILVSATLAQVAERNGIDALHFWMVVLVAFELGYLTPPVALNHLLTRAVVGDAGDEDDLPAGASTWRRHERYLLPLAVMGTALVVVAFGPLLVS